MTLGSKASKGSCQWSEVSVSENKAGGQKERGELRHLFAKHLWNPSLDTKNCTQHLVGEIKPIHMKTTRPQTTYGTDEQMENAVV